MYCAHCGTQNKDDSLFCCHCGKKLILPLDGGTDRRSEHITTSTAESSDDGIQKTENTDVQDRVEKHVVFLGIAALLVFAFGACYLCASLLPSNQNNALHVDQNSGADQNNPTDIMDTEEKKAVNITTEITQAKNDSGYKEVEGNQEPEMTIYDVRQEIKDALLGSGLVQINDCLVREDGTMTLGEFIDTIDKNCSESENLRFMVNDSDINMDGLNNEGDSVTCHVHNTAYDCDFFDIRTFNPYEGLTENKDLWVISVEASYCDQSHPIPINIHYAGDICAGKLLKNGLEKTDYYNKALGVSVSYDNVENYLKTQGLKNPQLDNNRYKYVGPPLILDGTGQTIRYKYSFNVDLQSKLCVVDRSFEMKRDSAHYADLSHEDYLSMDEAVKNRLINEVKSYYQNEYSDPYEAYDPQEGSVEFLGFRAGRQYNKTEIDYVLKCIPSADWAVQSCGQLYILFSAEPYIGYDGRIYNGHLNAEERQSELDRVLDRIWFDEEYERTI